MKNAGQAFVLPFVCVRLLYDNSEVWRQEARESLSEAVEKRVEAEALEPESGLTKQVEEEQVQATEFEEFEGMYNKAM